MLSRFADSTIRRATTVLLVVLGLIWAFAAVWWLVLGGVRHTDGSASTGGWLVVAALAANATGYLLAARGVGRNRQWGFVVAGLILGINAGASLAGTTTGYDVALLGILAVTLLLLLESYRRRAGRTA